MKVTTNGGKVGIFFSADNLKIIVVCDGVTTDPPIVTVKHTCCEKII